MNNSGCKNTYFSDNLIRFVILIYWSLYWLFNSIDKLIGGSQFLWVGRDRFAQFQRFFASAGWGNPLVADIALIIVAALEIFSFIFFTGALIHLFQKKQDSPQSWFVVGISLTLAIFTIFSIGDQYFGDHAELLEHTLFWFLTLFSWFFYNYSDQLVSTRNSVISKKQLVSSFIVLLIIVLVTTMSIFKHNNVAFHERTDAVEPQLEGENLYKCAFSFLAGSASFENTIAVFKQKNPNKKIKYIYTAPDELRKQKADGLIIYIVTENQR